MKLLGVIIVTLVLFLVDILVCAGVSFLALTIVDWICGTLFLTEQNVAILTLIIWVVKRIGKK
jgi:hypothetical protein